MMGMESYLVRMVGDAVDYPAVTRFAVSKLGLVAEPNQSPSTSTDTYYSYRDDRHVIEFEFSPRGESFQISVRFALCHPTSVDVIFSKLIFNFLDEFPLTAIICEELPPGNIRQFTAASKQDFERSYSLSVSQSRVYWRKMFGFQEAGMAVSDALQRYVFPTCVPNEPFQSR
jgi:hypothetical protein